MGDPPRFWQISKSYSNRGEGQIIPTTTYLPPGFLHLPTGLVNICGSVHKDRDRKKWGKTNDSRSSLMCNGICHGIGEKVFSRVQSFSFTHQNAGAAAHHHRDFIALFIAIDLRLLVAARLLLNRLWSFKLCESKISIIKYTLVCRERYVSYFSEVFALE